MAVSERTYQQLTLEDTDSKWELHCGRLVEKPGMTAEHYLVARVLGHLLQSQLALTEFIVAVDNAKLRRSEGSYFIPDVAVIPMAMVRQLLAQPQTFEMFDQPLPLVVEVWSPSTGAYDVTNKLPDYQRRGDAEIWLIHPYERTVTAWRRQPDGSYTQSQHTSGALRPVALAGVAIDLEALFS